jgi:type IV pilus assembly protein PilB
MPTRIGELLVQKGVVIGEQVEEALEIQKEKKMRLGEILVELGYINSRDLTRMLCEQKNMPYMELQSRMFDLSIVHLFPMRFLYKNNIIPLYEIDDVLYVATGDPTNRNIVNKLQEFTNKEIVLFGAEPEQIAELLNKYLTTDQKHHKVKK